MKYILFVIFPLFVVFGSFLAVVKVERDTEGLRQGKMWNSVFKINYDYHPSIIYRKGRDGL